MRFRTPRVINEDLAEPGSGFGERRTTAWRSFGGVLKGSLEHRDGLVQAP